MLRFVFSTDLHGSTRHYEAIFNYAKSEKISLINLGADLLPKGSGILEMQKSFVNGYLKSFYERCKAEGIEVLASFGNDDIVTRKKYFRKYGLLLDEFPVVNGEYTFKAYSAVCDYPFGLKDACKLDKEGWRCPDPYISAPVTFDETGRHVIEDVEDYFRKKGTIEEDLRYISVDSKTIMSMHMPPAGVGLDVCYGGRKVGSKAIYNFIEEKQPLAVLSGHIHESPKVSGVWYTRIDNTVVIQPGQEEDSVVMVDIYLNGTSVEFTSVHL